MSNTVIRNTSWLTLSAIVQKLISFLYFIVIARLIGVGNTGQYFFAISFTTIFTVIADFGLGSVLTREGAKYPNELEKYVNTVLGVKLFFGVISYAAIIFVSNYLGYAPKLTFLIALSGITMFFDNVQTAFYSGFRAKQNLRYEAIGNIGAQIVAMVIGSVALYVRAPLYWLILAYTIPSFMSCVYGKYFLTKLYNIRLYFTFDILLVRKILLIAIPFAAASILGRVYSYADLVLMSKMLTHTDLGLWSIPYKIVFAFQFIPTALSAALYPAMSSFFMTDAKRVAVLFTQSLRYLALFSVPLSLFLFSLAKPLVLFLFGLHYADSAPVLQLLALSLTCTYTSLLTGSLLNASNRQKWQTGLIGGALLVNLSCNYVLLPLYGILGAAISALISSVTLMLSGLFLAHKTIAVSLGKLLLPYVLFIVPGALAAFLAFVVANRAHVLLAVVSGGLVYLLLLYLFKLFKISDVTEALGAFRSKAV